MQARTCSLFVSVAMALSLQACASTTAPSTYSAGPTHATIVDEATGEPIEGAVVVAEWELMGGSHFDRVGTLVIREAVTDAAGKFRIEGWGPIPRPTRGYLFQYDPRLLILKPGYRAKGELNDKPMTARERVALERRDSVWNGLTIRIRKMDPTIGPDERRSLIMAARTALGISTFARDCSWKAIPKAIAALDKDLATIGWKGGYGDELMARQECAPLDDFKRAYREAN